MGHQRSQKSLKVSYLHNNLSNSKSVCEQSHVGSNPTRCAIWATAIIRRSPFFVNQQGPPCAGTSRSSPLRTAPGRRNPSGHRCRRWWRRCCGPARFVSVSSECRCLAEGWHKCVECHGILSFLGHICGESM